MDYGKYSYNFFKSKVLLKITNFKKSVVDGEEKLEVISTRYETIKGRELWASVVANPKAHPIEVCYEMPEKFKFGVVYGLCTGDRAWIFNLTEDGDNV